MGYILSCSTIPSRLNTLLKIIPHIKCRYKYFVINLCVKYRRFGEFKIPRELIYFCKTNKRVVFNIVDDYGPICKYIGGFNFMKKKRLYDDKLIIIDDDTYYIPDLFYDLMEHKTANNITTATGSGFVYDNDRNYKCVYGETQMVEGYGGICFNYNQCDDFLVWFTGFYKHINNLDSVIDKYLMACFLGDDFLISDSYNDKWAIHNGRQYLKPQEIGFTEDALHKNNVFGSNMGSYKYLHDNYEILKTFKRKYALNSEINKISHQL